MNTLEMKGADPCPKCSNAPMAIIKTPAYTDRDNILREAVYEVGCVVCWPELVEAEDGQPFEVDSELTITAKRVSYSARELSVAKAVDRWNAGDYVEDYYFNRCPMTLGDVLLQPK